MFAPQRHRRSRWGPGGPARRITVPGLTGEAALQAAGPAAERFLALRKGSASSSASASQSGAGYVGNETANYLEYNNITGVTAGTRPVTVYYASGAARSVQISVNGWAPDLDRITLT